VASVFSFEGAGSWMDTFHTMAGVPVRTAWKESRHRLPLRRVRRRALRSADVRRGASPPSRKVAGFHHGASLERGRPNVSVRGFGLCKQMVDLPVYIPDKRHRSWSGKDSL
jgi:hypothetical protein